MEKKNEGEVCGRCGRTEGVRWVAVVTAWYSFSDYLCIQCEAIVEAMIHKKAKGRRAGGREPGPRRRGK